MSAYDRVFGQLTAQAARHVAGQALLAASPESGPGLDCATGPGYVVEEALRRGVPGHSLVGVDFSVAMLERARERVGDPDVRWMEMDIQKPPPPDVGIQEFAWCTCNFGVLHLARPDDFFSVARQVLRPRGALVFTVWAELAKSPAFQIPLQAIETYGTADVGLPPGPPFFKYSDPDVSTEALVAAGFAPGSIRAEILDMEWALDRPEDLWDVFYEGTARTGGMLARQEEGAKVKMKEFVREALLAAQPAGHAGPPYILKQPCLQVTAVAPAA